LISAPLSGGAGDGPGGKHNPAATQINEMTLSFYPQAFGVVLHDPGSGWLVRGLLSVMLDFTCGRCFRISPGMVG
jgi:flagellar biosynthesis protein FliQ